MPTHNSTPIPIDPDDFFMAFFKACGALGHIAHNELWALGKGERAVVKLGSHEYLVEVQATDATGAKVIPDKGANFISFAISSPDGTAEEMSELEAKLAARLRQIREENLEYVSSRPLDIAIRDADGELKEWTPELDEKMRGRKK